MYFVLRNRKCSNFWFFILRKIEKTRNATKNRFIVPEDGGHVVIQNKGSETRIYKSLFNQEQSQGHDGSIILQLAVRSVTSTPYILLPEASGELRRTRHLRCTAKQSVQRVLHSIPFDTRRDEAIKKLFSLEDRAECCSGKVLHLHFRGTWLESWWEH